MASRGVAAGFCSDTAGSCRIPAAHTGTVGFRPSLNCYNAAGGIVPQTTSRDTVGTAAACLAVCTLVVINQSQFGSMPQEAHVQYTEVQPHCAAMHHCYMMVEDMWQDSRQESAGMSAYHVVLEDDVHSHLCMHFLVSWLSQQEH